MNSLADKDIITFLKDNIEPLTDDFYGLGYRASATLKDGTYLPCVTFRNPHPTVNVAIRRLKEEQTGKSIFSKYLGIGYREIVKTFVTSGNCVNHFDIAKVDKSRFAFPLAIQKQIHGETAMSWTAFVARFRDGRLLSFGTTWNWEYFNLPHNYNAEDIVEILNHSYLLKTGEIIRHGALDREVKKDQLDTINMDRQFFECYIDNL